MDVRQLQAELRGIVQGPKRAQGWVALMGLLTPLYWEGAAPALREQVEEEVLPGLKAELERSWPAGLRVVGMHAPGPLRALGGTLGVELFPTQLRDFMRTRGQKTNGHLSKAALKVLPGLLWGDHAFEGVRIDHLTALHEAFMEALLSAAPDSLRRVRLRLFKGSADEARAAAQVVVALRGPVLASYGARELHGSGAGALDALYRPLIESAGALGALRHLELPPLMPGEHDTTAEILGDARFAGLESVSFMFGIPAAHQALLMGREGSRNLVRVGAAYIGQNLGASYQTPQQREAHRIEEERLRRLLVGAPSLSGVQVWDLRSGARDDEGWETEDAALCAALRAGREERWGERLDAAVVDLSALTAAQTRQVLCEGEGLRASARLEALRVGAIDEATLGLLLARAHEAWPRLLCLIIMRPLSVAECAQVHDSALLTRLDVLDWAGLKHSPHMPQVELAWLEERERLAAIERLVEQAMDEALHPLFAYGLLEQALRHVSGKRQASRLARAMGMEPSALGAGLYGMLQTLSEHFFAVRGARHKWMMHAGPAYGGELKWPMEVE